MEKISLRSVAGVGRLEPLTPKRAIELAERALTDGRHQDAERLLTIGHDMLTTPWQPAVDFSDGVTGVMASWETEYPEVKTEPFVVMHR